MHTDERGARCTDALSVSICAPSVAHFFAASAMRPPSPLAVPAAAPLRLGIIPPRSSCGRGMTWTLMTWPMRPAASAPASMAAFTAATSPRTKAVTMPLPALSQPIISTFAAFSIASVPSIRATNPLHSSNPKASIGMASSFLDQLPVVKLPVASEGRRRLYWQLATRNWQLLHQFHIRRRLQVAGVAFVGVDVHFEDDLRVVAHAEVVER